MFSFKLKKIVLSCPKHKRYNPAVHGQSGIRGGCMFCDRMLDIYRQIKSIEYTAEGFQLGKANYLKNQMERKV
jgi:hypothetical protein